MALWPLFDDLECNMIFYLRQSEIEVLFRQKPQTKDNGGFQHLLVTLQNRTSRKSGRIALFDRDIEKIRRYAFAYGNGGWEWRLKAIFARILGPNLGGDRPRPIQLTFDCLAA